MTDSLLTIDEASEYVHVSVDTLRYWRHKGTGPKSFRMGRRVFFRQSDLDAFIAEKAAAAR